jgi:hypothetical protein
LRDKYNREREREKEKKKEEKKEERERERSGLYALPRRGVFGTYRRMVRLVPRNPSVDPGFWRVEMVCMPRMRIEPGATGLFAGI